MSDLRRIGTTYEPSEHIQEADFEEIDGDPIPQLPKAKHRRFSITPKQALISGVIGLVLCSFISIISTPTDAPAPDKPPEISAQQMLTEWTKLVTGTPSDRGFYLVNGSGNPGSSCNNRDGTQMIKFGGMALGKDTPLQIYDYFSMFMSETNTLIAGAFWFDRKTETLTVRNAGMFDPKGNAKGSLPDSTTDVLPMADGRLTYRDVKFHVCRYDEKER